MLHDFHRLEEIANDINRREVLGKRGLFPLEVC